MLTQSMFHGPYVIFACLSVFVKNGYLKPELEHPVIQSTACLLNIPLSISFRPGLSVKLHLFIQFYQTAVSKCKCRFISFVHCVPSQLLRKALY